jgi:hypothetical protein
MGLEIFGWKLFWKRNILSQILYFERKKKVHPKSSF